MDHLFRRFDVSDLDLKRRMRDYSHGMKRKLGLIQALMTDAPVLILDEPTSGLDPLMIEAFSETIDELARAGRATVFMSSHILSEVDRVCQRIGLVRQGGLVAVRTLAEMRSDAPRRVTIHFSQPVCTDIPSLAGIVAVARETQQWVVEVSGPLGGFVSALAGLPVADIGVDTFTLEDTILRLLGERRS
jgi:ABC-2 type transport system ATP-binding protein